VLRGLDQAPPHPPNRRCCGQACPNHPAAQSAGVAEARHAPHPPSSPICRRGQENWLQAINTASCQAASAAGS
jgi:hypothetical protein